MVVKTFLTYFIVHLFAESEDTLCVSVGEVTGMLIAKKLDLSLIHI